MEKLIEIRDALVHIALLFTVGAAIALFQALGSSERASPKVMLARALATGGLATAAGAVLLWMPAAPLEAQIGLAAALASLGTSGLERMFSRWLEQRGR